MSESYEPPAGEIYHPIQYLVKRFFVSLHYFVESVEKTWWNKDILCLDFEIEIPNDIIIEPKFGGIIVRFINFSLIVDPNDPLFEDEIKASSICPNTLAFNV